MLLKIVYGLIIIGVIVFMHDDGDFLTAIV